MMKIVIKRCPGRSGNCKKRFVAKHPGHETEQVFCSKSCARSISGPITDCVLKPIKSDERMILFFKSEIKRRSDSYRRRNWTKIRLRKKESKERYPERILAKQLRKYGITVEDFQRMLKKQEGLCSICKKPPSGIGRSRRLYVDHSHKSKKVRTLLCSTCNLKLGWFEKYHRAILSYAL